MTQISEDIDDLIRFAESGGHSMVAGAYPRIAAALRELQEIRKAASRGMLGVLQVMEPWTEETD